MVEVDNDVITKTRVLRNKSTGRRIGTEKYQIGSGHNASIDECPPPGLTSKDLLKEPQESITTSVSSDSRLLEELDKEKERSED